MNLLLTGGEGFIGSQMAVILSEAGFTGHLNTGNQGEFTMPQLAETILRLHNSKSKLVFVPLPSDDPKQRQSDIVLATKLGWESQVSLEDGLSETIGHFRVVL